LGICDVEELERRKEELKEIFLILKERYPPKQEK